MKTKLSGITNIGYWLTSSVSRNGGDVDSAWYADSAVDYVQLCPSFEGLSGIRFVLRSALAHPRSNLSDMGTNNELVAGEDPIRLLL